MGKLSILDVAPIDFTPPTKGPSLWDRIEGVWWNFYYGLHSIKDGVQNILYYLPVIWRDRYWDFEYFLLMFIKHKALRDAECFYKNNITKDSLKTSNDLNILVGRIDKFLHHDDIFEANNQKLLKEIDSANNEIERDELIRQFYIKKNMDKIRTRHDIYNFLKKECDKWWD